MLLHFNGHNALITIDEIYTFEVEVGSKRSSLIERDALRVVDSRFLNPAMANKNRIQPPSKIVHFFNTPPDLTEETVHRVFVERGIEAPTTVKLFPLKSERSSSGLIEFSSVGIAVAAIMECNHTALENSSTYIYIYTALKKEHDLFFFNLDSTPYAKLKFLLIFLQKINQIG